MEGKEWENMGGGVPVCWGVVAVRVQSDNVGTGTINLNMSGPNIVPDILRNVLNIIIT